LLSLPWSSAQAGVKIDIGIGWPILHPWHHHPYVPRVYVAPAPVNVVPAPAPAAVYVQPAPAVVPAPVVPTSPPPALVPRSN
jgi:hypothetical protein